MKNNLSKVKAEKNDLSLYLYQIKDNQSLFQYKNHKASKAIEIIRLENEDLMNRILTKKGQVSSIAIRLKLKLEEVTDYTYKVECIAEANLLRSQISNEIIKRNHLRNILNKGSLLINSKIIESITQINQLKTWLNFGNDISFKLLYRMTDNGFSPNEFHSRCDYTFHTLTLLKIINGVTCGGYTKILWNSFGFQADSDAFLFNLSLNKKYNINDVSHAIYAKPDYLAVFGVNDLKISTEGIKSKFPTSYGKDNGAYLELTGGVNDVKVIEIEVFQILIKK